MKSQGNTFDERDFAMPRPFVRAAMHAVHHVPRLTDRLWRREWVLDYSLDDCGRCRVGAEAAPWLARGPGIAHLYPPQTPYWEDSRGLVPPFFSTYIVFVGGEFAGFDRLTRNPQGFARFADHGGRVGQRLVAMAAVAAGGGAGAVCTMLAGFYEIAGLLLAAQPQPPGFEFAIGQAQDAPPRRSFAEAVRQRLAERLLDPLDLAQLAASLRVSPSTLSHRYKAETGESPGRTHLRLRVNLAKGLLLKGASVKEAAAQSGFYDEFHFSRTYKRLTGDNPSRVAGEG